MSKGGLVHWMVVKCIMRYLKGTLALQIMPWKQGYHLERILQCRLGGKCKRLAIHGRTRVSCWRWSHFVEMKDTTNHYLVYDRGRLHGYQPLHDEKVWLRQRMWDTCKKDQHPSCATIKVAYHLHKIQHTILAPNISMYNITSLERNQKTK